MLQHLTIRQFAIIEHIELDLDAGFTVVTGETGAGKSIVVDALSLLTGARADRDWVRDGARQAELTAEFDLSECPLAADWLKVQALSEESSCLIRRVLAAGGGSRAFINGRPATLSQLRDLGALLLQLHGQHEHQRLMSPKEQRQLLDDCGVPAEQIEAVSGAFQEWQAASERLSELESAGNADPELLSLLEFQLEELDQHAISADALDLLEQEHSRLSRGSDYSASLQSAIDALSESDQAAASTLSQAITDLGTVADVDARLGPIIDTLNEALINVAEAASDLQPLLVEPEGGPQRLTELDAELGRLHDLARKHRTSPGKLTDYATSLRQRLGDLGNLEARRAEADEALAQAKERWQKAAESLSKSRREKGQALARKVNRLLPRLGMVAAKIGVTIKTDPSAPRESGQDQVLFTLKSNPGSAARPLAKIASGGELARLALAIKVAAGQADAIDTQVFDEVDAGIGGETAHAVGELLASLADQGQVLCVTHLAQVAASASQQLKVEKASNGSAAQVTLSTLTQEGRVEELARMLSGKQTSESLAHAKTLLK